MSNKILLKLFLTLIPLAIVYYFVVSGDEISVKEQSNIISSDELSNVKSISISENKKTVTLAEKNGHWVIQEKSDYPADSGKIRSFLLKLETLNTEQVVTEDQKNFPALGLEEGSKDLGKITITGNGQTKNLIFGKMRESTNEEIESGRYLRKDGENKAYLVFGAPLLDTKPANWANTEIANVSSSTATEVKQYQVEKLEDKVTKKEVYQFNYNPHPEDGAPSYQLPGLEAGKTIDVTNISQVITGLENLKFENVFSADDLAKKKKEVQFTQRTDYLLNNGLTYSVSTGKGKKNHYLKINVSFDEERAKVLSKLVAVNLENKKVEADKEASKEENKTPEKPIVKISSESEAQKLNEKYSKWIYQIPEYVAGKYTKVKEDLIAKPETPPTAPTE